MEGEERIREKGSWIYVRRKNYSKKGEEDSGKVHRSKTTSEGTTGRREREREA